MHIILLSTHQQTNPKAWWGCRGDGYQFDHLAFVASQGRNDKAQHFLSLFRHSQLYEVFINERLLLASQDYKTTDTFECKVRPTSSLC